MHINIGDKFVAVKKLNGFFNIGDVINITEIENRVISFVFDNSPSKGGQMDFNTCEKYFEKVEETTEKTPAITEERVVEIMENSEFEIFTSFDKCTIVSCRLPNGFVITEYSACVSPENYSEESGANICFDKIADKIWELEAYRLQQQLWEEECDCHCCCGDCEECECDEEFDECLDTDLDCDDCENFECPFNSNIDN